MPSKVERLALCFDGTWNTDRSNTNVSRLFRKIASVGTGCPEQLQFYDEGVGTRWLERIRGGVFGAGLDANIRQGYAWLAYVFEEARKHASETSYSAKPVDPAGGPIYVPGPDIFLFGFSRGAFTARSLSGLISYLGLPRLQALPEQQGKFSGEKLPLVVLAWELYAARPTDAELKNAKKDSALKARIDKHEAAVTAFRQSANYPVQIHFIGVWDTVGALGIPRVLDYKWIPRPSNKFSFHDTQLSACVKFAYHAVAIDENRGPYCVALWTGKKEKEGEAIEGVEQRWFPGAHADVGGGYEDGLLPEPPLQWMAQKAADHGLHFVNDRNIRDPATDIPYLSVAKPPVAFDLDGREYRSRVHDSYAEFMHGAYKVLRGVPGAGGRVYRRMLVLDDGINQTVDNTAYRKVDEELDYRPPNLTQAGRDDVTFNAATLDT